MNSLLASGIFAPLVEQFAPTSGGTITVDWAGTASDELAVQLAEGGDELSETIGQLPINPEDFDDQEWEHLPDAMNATLVTHLLLGRILPKLRFPSPQSARRVLASHARIVGECTRVLRLWALHRPEVLACLSPEVGELVLTHRVRWWAYLRSMWSLFWSAIRHPLCETTIDLSTGRVLYRT